MDPGSAKAAEITWDSHIASSINDDADAGLRSAPDNIRQELWEELHALAESPADAGGEALQWFAVGYYKLRVRSCRILYRVVPGREAVYVGRIGHRSRVYKGLEPFG